MYQFVDSLNKLSSLLGDSNSTNDDFFPLAIRKKELNRGEWQLAVDAKDLLGYVSGTTDSSLTISMPTDWVETYIMIINNYVITNNREISLFDWERYYNLGASYPYYYVWPGAEGTININLIGSVAEGTLYKLYYFKKPTSELNLNTDISLHQEEFREISAYYAASELMRQLGNNQKADEYRTIYEAGVQKADAWARKLYINKNEAIPDFGGNEPTSTDIQGRGYY